MCLSMDRKFKLICSVISRTTGCVDYNLIKSAGPASMSIFTNSCCAARQGCQNGGETQRVAELDKQHWNMKEVVDIYCLMSHSELWAKARGFLVAYLQSNVLQTPHGVILIPSFLKTSNMSKILHKTSRISRENIPVM